MPFKVVKLYRKLSQYYKLKHISAQLDRNTIETIHNPKQKAHPIYLTVDMFFYSVQMAWLKFLFVALLDYLIAYTIFLRRVIIEKAFYERM
jgi:hypothetical protein